MSRGSGGRGGTGGIMVFLKRVDYGIQSLGKIKTALFGGEGLFFALLTGPGELLLSSLSFSRLAGRIFTAAPQAPGRRRGEG